MMKRIFILLFFSIIVHSCKKQEIIQGFNKFENDKNIQHSQVFKSLDNHPEFIFYHRDENKFKNRKRSTNLIIKTELGGLRQSYNEFNSESFYMSGFDDKKTDTIAVLIDNFNGYYGNVVLIKIYKNQFKTEYLEPSDVGLPESFKDSIEILESKLILNKKNFKLHDSIYGKINFKVIFDKENVDVNGYFRTKITERSL